MDLGVDGRERIDTKRQRVGARRIGLAENDCLRLRTIRGVTFVAREHLLAREVDGAPTFRVRDELVLELDRIESVTT